MSAAPAPRLVSTRLSEAPLVHPTAEVVGGWLGRFTEIAERCVVLETTLGDYSYLMQDAQTWAARIGKFVNVASYTRINAPNHPVWRPTLHHFTYRANDYWPDANRDESIFDWRRENAGRHRPRRLDRPRGDDPAGRDRRQRRRDRRGRSGDSRRRTLRHCRRGSCTADQAAVFAGNRPTHGRARLVGLEPCGVAGGAGGFSHRSPPRRSSRNTELRRWNSSMARRHGSGTRGSSPPIASSSAASRLRTAASTRSARARLAGRGNRFSGRLSASRPRRTAHRPSRSRTTFRGRAVTWHAGSAVLAYDAQIAAAGITTVFDSFRVGVDEFDVGAQLGDEAALLAEAIRRAADADLLRADHLTHLRCEVPAPNVVDFLDACPRFATRRSSSRSWIIRPDSASSAISRNTSSITPASRDGPEPISQRSAGERQRIGGDSGARKPAAHRRDRQSARHRARQPRRHDGGGGRPGALATGSTIAEFPTTLEAAVGVARRRHGDGDGRAERRARRLAFRQRLGAGACRSGPARHPLIRLCAGGAVDGRVPPRRCARGRAASPERCGW